MDPIYTESTGLLADQYQNNVLPLTPKSSDTSLVKPNSTNSSVFKVLPIAFFASLSMAATSATTVYAYAHLVCADPSACKDSERNTYAGTVAISTCVAHVSGIFVMGFLERLVKTNQRSGLLLWLGCRAMSVCLLILGVLMKSITVAISGRLFEGFASDNILHFNLNAIYVQQAEHNRVSFYMGVSLGLFMVGMAVGPAISGSFKNFIVSFIIALGIFAFSIIYVCIFIRPASDSDSLPTPLPPDERARDEGSESKGLKNFLHNFLSPLRLFWQRPRTLFHGLSMLLHNTVQGYLFTAIMVFASVQFGFTSVQNGNIISIAAGTSAIYLFVVFIAVPNLIAIARARIRWLSNKRGMLDSQRGAPSPDAFLAISSIIVEIVAVFGFSIISQSWQIYPVVAVSALGLAAPSFMKSHLVSINEDGPQAVAALAVMEGIGSLLAPIILGGWQTAHPNGSVFKIATAMLGLALFMFTVGAYMGRKRKSVFELSPREDFQEGVVV